MLHLFPHWNWLPGQTVDLWCYFNHADEVELFINGKSQGVRRKAEQGGLSTLNSEFHVGWRVQFEPGEVKAVSRRDGKVVAEQVIKTAGAPHHIRLSIDYAGRDLTFVNAEVVDKDGNLCPWAEDQLFFLTDGGAQVIASDNGSQTSMERFTASSRKAFFGRCMAVVRGKGVLKAQSYTLGQSSLDI